jgi:hypothetical protein
VIHGEIPFDEELLIVWIADGSADVSAEPRSLPGTPRKVAFMIAKPFTPFLGVQPFVIMGFPGSRAEARERSGGDAERSGPLTHESSIRDISADSS